MDSNIIKFQIVGVFPSEAYQKCKVYATLLHQHFPGKFESPIFRPMLDVQWNEYLQKTRRKIGGRLWCLESCVAVFQNGEFFGDEEDLINFSKRNYHFNLFCEDFQRLGELQLYKALSKSERTYIYFTIALDEFIIGSILIELFTDLVPLTCANFIRLCQLSQGGYKNCEINRIVENSWIQIGGCHLKSDAIPCENYCIPHDQRGVISMCHNGKHSHNSTQFMISLNPTPWMDCYYVAFGKVVQGDEVLCLIENVAAEYEVPLTPITIKDCGEYVFKNKPDKFPDEDFAQYIASCKRHGSDEASDSTGSLVFHDGIDARDVDSDLFYSCAYEDMSYCHNINFF